MEIFEFKPFQGIALTPSESENLIKNNNISINCGRDKPEFIKYNPDKIILKFKERYFEIEIDVLDKHINRRSIILIDNEYEEAEIRTIYGYYKLVPVDKSNYVTLEINGIHMHRVKGITPMEDAKRKVIVAGVKKGSKVLEIGTGLGYTSINSIKFGAEEVVSIEKDENVLWLAERNPWSRELSSNKIKIILGDAAKVIKELNMEFDVIIHDPPRFTSSTGELYSQEFYNNLFLLLRKGGTIFHYTGEPGRVKRKNFPSIIASKLKSAGFKVLRYDKVAMGIKAIKQD